MVVGYGNGTSVVTKDRDHLVLNIIVTELTSRLESISKRKSANRHSPAETAISFVAILLVNMHSVVLKTLKALETKEYPKRSLGDNNICDLDKTPDLSQRPPQNCPKCGHPVNGHYCQGCALLLKKFKEDLFTSCIELGILQDSSEPSNDNTNVVNAPREPFVRNQDPGNNSSQSPPQINDHCCYGCGDSLEVPFVYPEPCYNQDFNFPQEFQEFHDFQQHNLCCENCGVIHEAYQCQPKNAVYYHEQNYCYDSNSFGLDQFQPQQYTVNHPIFNVQNDLFDSQNKLMEQLTPMYDMVGQFIKKKEEEKQIEEEEAANGRYWKIPACYDDDDDDYAFAITRNEPINSLSMGDKHLDTIPATKSDEFIKSSVENLVVAFCPGLRFVLDCVLSSTAFCLFEDHLLRFAKDRLCQNQNSIAFCLRLRFA
nr:hypothetical protein [Tanacetum cinerariifolium]